MGTCGIAFKSNSHIGLYVHYRSILNKPSFNYTNRSTGQWYMFSIIPKLVKDRPLVQLLSAHAIGAGGLGFKFRVGQIGTASPTARYRCEVPSELCSPGAKPRRWLPRRWYTLRRNTASIMKI